MNNCIVSKISIISKTQHMKNKDVIAGISGVAYYLPQLVKTSAEIEELINVHLKPAITPGSIERMTGIIKRHVSGEDEYNSTLAIAACRILFEKEKIFNAIIPDLVLKGNLIALQMNNQNNKNTLGA